MDHEQILELLHIRHACKQFDSQKIVTDSDMELILQAGRLSPSSMGTEPWKFLVIANKDLLNDLVPLTPGGAKQLATCSHLVIVLSRQPQDLKHNSEYMDYLLRQVKQLPEEAANQFKERIAFIEKNRFKHQDNAILHYSTSQAYLAVANMALVGAMIGVDSCPIGAFNSEAVREILVKHQLLDPEHFTLTLFLAFGYRANAVTPKKRQPLEEVVKWVK